MVAFGYIFEQGDRQINGGTAYGDECQGCGQRFTRRYYFNGCGPLCGACASRRLGQTEATYNEPIPFR